MSTSPSTPRSTASLDLAYRPYTMPLTSAYWYSEKLGVTVVRRVSIFPIVYPVLGDLFFHAIPTLLHNRKVAWARSSLQETNHSRTSSEWNKVDAQEISSPELSGYSDVGSVDSQLAFDSQENRKRQEFFSRVPNSEAVTSEPKNGLLNMFFSLLPHSQQSESQGAPLENAQRDADGVARVSQIEQETLSDFGVEELSSSGDESAHPGN